LFSITWVEICKRQGAQLHPTPPRDFMPRRRLWRISPLKLLARVAESEVSGWSRSCIPLATLGFGVLCLNPTFQMDHFLDHTPKLCWEFLLKWYNSLRNFCWNSEWLCTTISIQCLMLQNSWQPNFNHFMLRSRNRESEIWKGRSWSWSRTFYLRLRNPCCSSGFPTSACNQVGHALNRPSMQMFCRSDYY